MPTKTVPEIDKRFYGRRKGKPIRASRQRLMDELLPQVRLYMPPTGMPFNWKEVFGINPREVWLEVGFGGGEHVAELSLTYPDVGFVGAEPFMNGVASLLAHLNGSHQAALTTVGLAKGRQDNVRIWPDDIRLVFPAVPSASFDRIFVLYPDPWPKARHAERRFINQANLPELYRMLKDDGSLYVATDVAEYAVWALEQALISGLFVQVQADTTKAPADWVPTRYEKKGLLAGRQPVYLIFRKKK